MIRLVVMLLAAATADQSTNMCEVEAVTKWNTFAIHAKDYMDARTAGVRDVKMRARMRKEFEAVMACECF